MASKGLTGSVLIIAPVVVFVCFGLLWPASNAETAAEAVSELMASETLSRWSGAIGTIAFISLFIGYTIVARFLSEGGKPSASAALRASIIFPILGSVALASSGLTWGSITAASAGLTQDAETIYLIGDYIGSALGIFWGPAIALVGIAIARQYTDGLWSKVLGYALAVLGVLFFVLTFVDSFQDSWLGIVVWLGFTILTVLVGVWVVRLDSGKTA